jgi:hypothetical protein
MCYSRKDGISVVFKQKTRRSLWYIRVS